MMNFTIDNRILFGFIIVVAIFNFILFISMVRHRIKYRNSGYIISSIHSRETTFNYIRIVENGQTDQVLSDEEKIVLEQALGYRER